MAKSKLIFALCIFCVSASSQIKSTVVSSAGVVIEKPIGLTMRSGVSKNINVFTLSGSSSASYSISSPKEIEVVKLDTKNVKTKGFNVTLTGLDVAEKNLDKFGKRNIEVVANLNLVSSKTNGEYYGRYEITFNYN